MAASVPAALAVVRAGLASAVSAAGRATAPRLVAVSKLKTNEHVLAAYGEGQRHFGENYVQEFCEKAPQLPSDIAWHFIGHLQSNKCKQLVGAVPNLYVVETVDSAKLARKLNAACANVGRTTPLRVLIQVNTSGEDAKSGLPPLLSSDDASGDAPLAEVVRFVLTECPHLRFAGLMTIGRYDGTPVDCFEALVSSRDAVAPMVEEAGVLDAGEEMELSMGMSGDYPLAVQLGSTSIRVGSAIFGSR